MQLGSTASAAVPDGRGLRVGLVVSRFNETITTRLREGAEQALRAAGVLAHDIERMDVPGAFELPVAAKVLAVSRRLHAASRPE
jgi:6,7-dimethyl-8-ribityllumazine synthase